MERTEKLELLQSELGYRFRNTGLLEEALTHSSYAHEHGLVRWNERLEFLGDAVLEVSASKYLYGKYPALSEGELTRYRSSVVCKRALTRWADHIRLRRFLRLGKGMVTCGDSHGVFADAAEALFGAVFVDGGYDSAENLLLRYLRFQDGESSADAALDPKSELQRFVQENSACGVSYFVSSVTGPSHAPLFTVAVEFEGHVIGEGNGASRREAEFDAARNALLSLAVPENAVLVQGER
jgi:ribonuclease-3